MKLEKQQNSNIKIMISMCSAKWRLLKLWQGRSCSTSLSWWKSVLKPDASHFPPSCELKSIGRKMNAWLVQLLRADSTPATLPPPPRAAEKRENKSRETPPSHANFFPFLRGAKKRQQPPYRKTHLKLGARDRKFVSPRRVGHPLKTRFLKACA
jgi:hypothetical protein